MRLAVVIVVCFATAASASPKRRCTIDPVPATPVLSIAATPCHRAPASVATAIRKHVGKHYAPTRTGAKPAVTFPCDGLGPTIREIVVESGNGHGGSLGMWRATRSATGFDVRGIWFSRRGAHELVSGTVSIPDLETVRAGLAARVGEQAPSREDAGFSFTSSSYDFHLVVRLVDSEGRTLERRFTGYESSRGQDVFLGLQIATRTLAPIIAIDGAVGSPTADDRKLFEERFVAAVPYFDTDSFWWVMERYVELARDFGTRVVIGGLLTRLVITDPDRSKLDARVDALEAIARISGWDARPGVTVEAAAAAYLRECR